MGEKLPSIFIDHDFFTKSRNRRWIQKHGAEGVIILQQIWIEISQERDCLLPADNVYSIAYPLSFSDSKIKEVVDSAIACGLLEIESNFLLNSRIAENHKRFFEKQNNYKIAAKIRENSKKILPESPQNPTKILTELSQNPKEREQEREQEQETESNKEATPAADTRISAPLDAAITRWRKHLRTNHKRNFDQLQMESLVLSYGSREAELITNIDYSIAGGWRTVCSKPIELPKERPKPESKSAAQIRHNLSIVQHFTDLENDTTRNG